MFGAELAQTPGLPQAGVETLVLDLCPAVSGPTADSHAE